MEPPGALLYDGHRIDRDGRSIPQDGSGLSVVPAVAGAASPLSRAVGGGLEIAGMVLTGGLALGVGSPSVADLSGGLLLLTMGRAIRLPSREPHVLSWLAMTVALVAVAVRWGAPSIEAIQGAHGVLGLTVGTEAQVAATVLAASGAVLGLAIHLADPPPGVEERIIQGGGAVAGGLAVAAAFLARAGSEGLTFPLGVVVGAVALGLAWLLPRAPRRLALVAAAAGPVLAIVGLGLVVSGL